MRKLEQFVFFLLLTSIPIQLGKHFWPDFAFVQGIRLDYLSPTIYLSDILLLVLFLLTFKKVLPHAFALLKNKLVVVFAMAIVVSSLFSSVPIVSFFGILTLLKIWYLAVYVSAHFNSQSAAFLIWSFTLGGLIVTAILWMQFVNQGSIGGVFYFLGERTFSSSTPGIALFSLNDSLVLRPYGTFPHPNVAAFYLFMGFLLNLYAISQKTGKEFGFRLIVIMILTTGIITTFSRSVILLMLVALLIWMIKDRKLDWVRQKWVFLTAMPLILLGFGVLFIRIGENFTRDLGYRLELLRVSFFLFLSNPFFGVGINNFYYHEVIYQKVISPTLLQPVHNIFVHILISIGLLGSIPAFLFVRNLVKRSKDSSLLLTLVASVIMAGFIDHYFLTLQQGQLMLGLIIGLVLTNKS